MKALGITDVHLSQVLWGVGLFVLGFVLSTAALILVVIHLPPTYFQGEESPPFWPDRPAWQRALGRAGKNLLGLALVALGIVLSLPGVPGQGLLTILVGIMLLDVPGKRRLERRLVRKPAIFKGLNRLRERFHKEKFTLDDAPQ
jgi:hypothetical protein